jgi:hypothetical protein
MCISEARSKIACQGEQCHGLRLWLVHLVKHFFIHRATPSNGEISWDAFEDTEAAGAFTSKTMRSKLLTS